MDLYALASVLVASAIGGALGAWGKLQVVIWRLSAVESRQAQLEKNVESVRLDVAAMPARRLRTR